MSGFPDWARPWLAAQNDQVSHGLNLVLELDPTPNRLPLLLWDIVLAQDKIKRALEELSFVHYARFVPSWDGEALMVTTDFDGPLDPYVLDFVIALGDVFDTLLSYVRTPPKMPVREHPDEFLAWVRQWNRVPFYLRKFPNTLFPEDFDYPLYSAYPDKTVTDIAGARTLPLPPALDHPAAVVDLADVQGNILRGYGARHGRYLFFSVANPAVARQWLATALPKSATPWLGVGSAAPWAGGAPGILTQVAMTHAGLAKLLTPQRLGDLAHFPTAFKQGAAVRAHDNFDRGSSEPREWIFGDVDEPVHVVLFLFTKEDVAPPAYLAAVKALETGEAEGLEWQRTMTGEWLGGKEPFGFADGISDPVVSGQCPGPEPAFQPSASPGEFLLHRNYSSIYGGTSLGSMAPGLASNGSFGVLRLMEQDLDGFRRSTDAEAARLGVAPELLRAKVVGRWPDGTPLALDPASTAAANPTNAFDYAPTWEFPDQVDDHEGLRCPVGAHVRRANPRSARVAGQRHSRRLLRRGMPSSWDDQGVVKVGLMGLFMGANIEQQFEFIQRQWLQGDLAASGIRGTTDALSAIRAGHTDFHFTAPASGCPMAAPRMLVAHIPPLVRTRGCLYLFFPGIAALKSLDAASPPVSTVALGLQEVSAAADGVVETLGQAVGDGSHVLGDVLSGFGKAADNVASAVASQVGIGAAIQSHIPGVDIGQFRDVMPALEALVDMPVLQNLAGGEWKNLVRDLLEPRLESEWFRDFIHSFAPPATGSKPPAGVHVADLKLGDPRFRADPYDALRDLRDGGKRIVWVAAQEACWVLGAADCQELFSRHSDFLQTPSKPPPPPLKKPLAGIVTLDQPRHTAVRSAYEAAFSVALARLEKREGADNKTRIERAVEGVVGGLKAETRLRQFDYMGAFAHPVARKVAWQLIGIHDPSDQQELDALADALVLHYGKTTGRGGTASMVSADAGLRLAARFAIPLTQAWALSSAPNNKYEGTLIGELAARMKPGLNYPHMRTLDFVETLLTLVQTVLASQSPHFLLGSAGLHLMSPDPRPERGGVTPWSLLAGMAGNPAGFDAALALALEETRRYEPPLTLVERYAKGVQTICGVQVPDGCAVFAMVASANRDKIRYGNSAEDFHADRPSVGHLSLGGGIHLCAGRGLQARLVPAALGALIRALPELRLSNPAARPPWNATLYFRSLQALTVTRCPP